MFWAPAPLTTKSWVDVEDDDDYCFTTTSSRRPVWGTAGEPAKEEDDVDDVVRAALQEEVNPVNFLSGLAIGFLLGLLLDGRYVSMIDNPDQRFAAFLSPLTLGRVNITINSVYISKVSLAIAVRYSLLNVLEQYSSKRQPFRSYEIKMFFGPKPMKLGGMNSLLQIETYPTIPLVSKVSTIILGMDVSHGSLGHSEECLIDFYTSSRKRKPDQVIIFRDGVSESQFNQVLNIELQQIIEACKFLDEKWNPKFTLIIDQKKHHTKFFIPRKPDNVPP
ncbi:hypothetical protein ACJX0J_019511, partial [Zea mays]